jgi:hypothetical protein
MSKNAMLSMDSGAIEFTSDFAGKINKPLSKTWIHLHERYSWSKKY